MGGLLRRGKGTYHSQASAGESEPFSAKMARVPLIVGGASHRPGLTSACRMPSADRGAYGAPVLIYVI